MLLIAELSPWEPEENCFAMLPEGPARTAATLKVIDYLPSIYYSAFPISWPLGYLLYIGGLTKFIAGFIVK